PSPQAPSLNAERPIIRALRDELAAFREGAGRDVDILVDLNFNFRTEGFVKVARALEPFDLFWVEIDSFDPAALQYIRSRIDIPVASLESQYTRRGYREFFERQAVDVAIVDTPWNGVAESLKIAAMADTYEVNVAPHNFYGHLATMMNAHFCAVAPNFRIMEIDVDAVPWLDELYTVAPRIEAGHLVLPTGPGWGTQLNAVRRQAAGGVVQQAIAAIENALLDVKARALGVPVYALFGGPVRERVRVYWSHCGTYRLARWQAMQIPRLKTLQDVVTLGKEVREK